jgi:hypothetical protein
VGSYVGTEGWSHRKENTMHSDNGNQSSRHTAQTDELELVGMTESERRACCLIEYPGLEHRNFLALDGFALGRAWIWD